MTCILCARRGRETRSESHVCVTCATWLQTQVADILRLAADAAAWLDPLLTQSSGGGGRTVPSSRPPLTVDALDPELTPVPVPGQPPHVWPTVLEVCESWERMVRQARQMVPYGPASASRAAHMAREAAWQERSSENFPATVNDTGATLSGCVAFLGRQVPWMTTQPDWPIDDFADEISACVRVLRRWDQTAAERGQVVPCPTITDDGSECGRRLHYRSMDEQVTCRSCGATRDVPQLLMAADADNALVDGEALAQRFNIDPSTIRKWARHGKIERHGQRYRFGDVRVQVETMRGRAG